MLLKCFGPCGETKEENDFSKVYWPSRHDRHNWCRSCLSAKATERIKHLVATDEAFRERRNKRERARRRRDIEAEIVRGRLNGKAWRQRNPSRVAELKRKYYAGQKAKVIAALGGRCSSPTCAGCDDERALQVDHPNGGGTKHREGVSPTRYWNEILRAPPGTYRLLCANCNWEHRLSLLAQKCRTTYGRIARAREEVIRHYGGACAKCGFDRMRALQLDHVKGGGCAERRACTSRTKYYRDAVKAPPGTFQVLCANHNWIKKQETPAERPGRKKPQTKPAA